MQVSVNVQAFQSCRVLPLVRASAIVCVCSTSHGCMLSKQLLAEGCCRSRRVAAPTRILVVVGIITDALNHKAQKVVHQASHLALKAHDAA